MAISSAALAMQCSSSTTSHTVYLSLGSNLGDKQFNIRRAIDEIAENVGRIVRQSSIISTEPWGFQSDNEFANACIAVETTFSPLQILDITQAIERAMGRTEKSQSGQYHDRIIDIDILLYDQITYADSRLVIPHPLMWQRDFVMIPLREICDVELLQH